MKNGKDPVTSGMASATVVPEYLGLKRIPALVHYVSARLLVFFAPEPSRPGAACMRFVYYT